VHRYPSRRFDVAVQGSCLGVLGEPVLLVRDTPLFSCNRKTPENALEAVQMPFGEPFRQDGPASGSPPPWCEASGSSHATTSTRPPPSRLRPPTPV